MKSLVFYILCLLSMCSFAQDNLSELLEKYNTKRVPYISVEQLAMPKTNAVILDAREPQEYEISHLKNAIYVGYDNFDINTVINQIPNKEQDIVVYCSLGIRSEIIASKLMKVGYINVKNLYGGIFEWKNKDFSIYNTQKKVTDSVHVFSKEWSKWLTKGIKVHE
ncbi:rhodanese-like domain-containing protein [Psychroserpens sp.]|uniref:rhodanese-like domain-containing protein n=1 Tax=Psychroserpens sp. TaxID=2020870 RepID=UPI00385AD3EC